MKKNRKGLMLVLSSPSGAGKTSICKEILKKTKELELSISYTTRPKRKSEVDSHSVLYLYKRLFRLIYNKAVQYYMYSILYCDVE